jgi:hypothetical protein
MKSQSQLMLIALFMVQTATAQIRVLAISDSAGFTPGLPAVGSLASVGLVGLTGINGVQSATGYPLPYNLAGVSVRVDGTDAPILAVADMGVYQQINIQVPAHQYQSPQAVEVSQFGQVGQLDVDFYSSHVIGAGTWGVLFTDSLAHLQPLEPLARAPARDEAVQLPAACERPAIRPASQEGRVTGQAAAGIGGRRVEGLISAVPGRAT